MNIYQYVDKNINNIIIIGSGLILFILIILLVVLISLIKTNKRYKRFLFGKDGASLETVIFKNIEDLNETKENIKKIINIQNDQAETLINTFQKLGVKKYDAFREMGGKLSFALAILNKNDTGFIINSVHSTREGCYIFIKEIINGESFIELSKDEEEALNIAKEQI